jgi:S-adenosylmethionine decarboxylase
MTGTHIIIDISNIFNNEKLKYSSTILPVMDKIVEQFQLKVVEKALHQFEPFGFTGVYVLSESHLSIHTFVDEGKITIDLFTCGLGVEDGNIKSIIKDYFGVNFLNIDAYYFTRGN